MLVAAHQHRTGRAAAVAREATDVAASDAGMPPRSWSLESVVAVAVMFGAHMNSAGWALTWRTLPENELPSICDLPANQRHEDFDCSWLQRVKEDVVFMDKKQRAATQSGILLALVPPALVLALGSALVWAFRGFR
jgi:hypothetical protein